MTRTVGTQADDVESTEVFSLHTPSMLAELLEVPVVAVRRWYRLGYLRSKRHVRRLPYFDFAEVAVARHLATLLNSGCSQATIDRKLRQLRSSLPEIERPISDPSVVVSGGQIVLRHGDCLSEPGGQLLIDFDETDQHIAQDPAVFSVESRSQYFERPEDAEIVALSACNQLQLEALKHEDRGELTQAAEIYRTLLMSRWPTAEVHYALADLLYRMGDLSAARERFYVAIELDEEYVEARASLGCVLAESGDCELAVAAFQGALEFDADYADVHYHLANTFERTGDRVGAEMHWRVFLALDPESLWADAVRAKLAELERSSDVVLTQ
ncbi:MAG: tetratricopeptide repeat protein [Planctomycetota bacterium]